MTDTPARELADALGPGASADLARLLKARLDLLDKHGHSAAADDELQLGYLAGRTVELAHAMRDTLSSGSRYYDLDVGERRAAQLGAMALALLRRIRTERARTGLDLS